MDDVGNELAAELLKQLVEEVAGLRRDLAARDGGPKPKRLLSKIAAARYLGVDRRKTLEPLIASGQLRTVKIDGRIRIPLAELERIGNEGTDVAESKPPTRRRSGFKETRTADEINKSLRDAIGI